MFIDITENVSLHLRSGLVEIMVDDGKGTLSSIIIPISPEEFIKKLNNYSSEKELEVKPFSGTFWCCLDKDGKVIFEITASSTGSTCLYSVFDVNNNKHIGRYIDFEKAVESCKRNG